jgi:hypothetical protein
MPAKDSERFDAVAASREDVLRLMAAIALDPHCAPRPELAVDLIAWQPRSVDRPAGSHGPSEHISFRGSRPRP